MKSSSLHRITTDGGNFFYKIMVRILYYPFNIINNRNPNKNIDPGLKITSFKPKNLKENYNNLDLVSSPSRKLSDMFWMNLDWETIEKELGDINICDLGCGSGNYYNKLQEYSKHKINSYIGFDISKNDNWKKMGNEKVRFKEYDGKNLIDLIPKETNLIISQSAIEHFKEDISLFKQLKKISDNADHKVQQIHLFPSEKGLKLYGFHGVRQYTPRTISKLTSIFTNAEHKEMLILGNKYSNKVHMDFIRKKDKRNTDSETYNKACYQAFIKDFEEDATTKDANFFALKIK